MPHVGNKGGVHVPTMCSKIEGKFFRPSYYTKPQKGATFSSQYTFSGQYSMDLAI